MTRATYLLAALAVAAIPGLAGAQVSVSGSVAEEARYFTQAPAFPGQPSERFQFSTSVEASASYDWNGGADRIVFSPFLRFGGGQDGRNHFDLREAYYQHQGDGWSLTAGFDKLFWGVTESRNPVDIVNQDDALEDIGGDEKLGQPMLALRFYGDYGTLGLYLLPWFRERAFTGPGTRLGGPAPIGTASFQSPDGAANLDYALRWSHSIGALDIGLSWFNGTAREPRMVASGPVLVPQYDLITQAGLDAQLTAGDWLWKLEAIRRSGQGPDFWATTTGFEWTLPGFGGTGTDLGLIAEYSRDTRDPAQAPATIFDDDLFLGGRLAFNDVSDSSLLAGALIDRATNARVLMLEGQRRIGDNWLISVEGRLFDGAAAPDPIAAIQADDYFSLELKRYF